MTDDVPTLRPGSWVPDPWPCGSCAYVTEAVPLGGWWNGRWVPDLKLQERVKHLETCDACRALGAPETLPAD